MAPLNLPSDLTKLSDEDINKHIESIRDRAETIAGQDSLSDADIEEIAALSQAAEALNVESQKRAAATEERTAKVSEAMAKIRGEAKADDAAGDEPKPEAKPEAKTEPPAPAPAPVAAEVVPVAASTVPAQPAGTLERMSNRKPRHATPREGGRDEFMRATVHAGLGQDHQFSSPGELASAMAAVRNSWSRIPDGINDQRVSIGFGTKHGFAGHLAGDMKQNYVTLRQAREQHQALVASGECLPPFSPSYDFYRLAEPQTPVEDRLTSVSADRGGIRFIVSPNTAAALASVAGAIDISTLNRDYTAAPGPNAGPKACARVTCPTVDEEQVSAISQCITFDNLQYKVFPELIESFMEDLAVAFASRKEVFYLDYIDTHSTAVTGTETYGASRALLRQWTRVAVNYRMRHGMALDATIECLAPNWAIELIKLDLAMQADRADEFWQITDEQAMAAIRARNIEVTWYNDAPTSKPLQKFNLAQAAGALNDFPSEVVAYFYAPGTFVRLDGGTLDVGLVRDSTLNGTNDLQMFMEEWLGMAKLGFESIRLTSSGFKANGAAPAGVTPF